MDDEGQCELEVPLFIELKESKCAHNDLGAYSTIQIGADQFIGSFKGKIKKHQSQCGDQTYVWTILSSRQVPLFYIDASDPKDSNWLRFIRFTSDPNKSNIMCMQQNQQINYFTAKVINQGDELLTYLPKKKGKNKNKNSQNKTYKLVDSTVNNLSKIEESSSSSFSTESSKVSNEEVNLKKQMKIITETDEIKPTLDVDDLTLDLEYIEPNITNRNILTDLNLTIQSKYEKTSKKIRLFKCSLCSFLTSNNQNESNCFNELKKHYIKTHLNMNEFDAFKIKNSDIDSTLLDLMNTILYKVESLVNKVNLLEFKCHICTEIYEDEDDLKEHLLKSHNKNDKLFSCLFCGKEFRKLNFFCSHMKTLHKEDVVQTQLITPVTSDFNTDIIDWTKLIDLKLIDEVETKSNDIDIDDSNSNDTSSSLFSSDKQDKNDDETKTDLNEKDEDTVKHKSHHKHKQMKLNKLENNKTDPQLKQVQASTNNASTMSKTWTCQMCKKQFDQRVELSKHQCIELNLKLLKKKKEIRKKKWREAHWKRKIDLSYIETTSLTQLSQNIADNLGFCIDGTNEDLKAYSREVKDYLTTELGSETQVQMFLKCCFPDVLKKIGPAASSNQFDVNLLSKSNSYFIDSVYTPNNSKTESSNHITNHKSKAINNSISNNINLFVYNCKSCKFKARTMPELIRHQREEHQLVFKTTFDCFNNNNKVENEIKSDECLNWESSNTIATSPIGYYGCDPFSYVINLHWDQTLQVKCFNCNGVFLRSKYSKHVLNCQSTDDSNEIETIRKEARNEEVKLVNETIHIIKPNDSFIFIETIHEPESDLDVCKKVVEDMIAQIESELELNHTKMDFIDSKVDESQTKTTKTNMLRISSRLRRSNQKKIENKNLIDKILNPVNHNSASSSASSSDEETNLPKKLVTKEITTSHVIEKFNTNNNRKMYECEKCGLEFTSSNSVIRHQEKSCLRVKVINLKSAKSKNAYAKKCPICAATFFNTHRVSIHIYKHHRNLLGSASLPPSSEAKRLNELQMRKFNSKISVSDDLDDIDESEKKYFLD